MITENFNAEENDPRDLTEKNDQDSAASMKPDADTSDDNDDDDDDLEEDMEDDEDDDDDDDTTILPSNDSGISADDNAATGRMHEKEGE